MKILNVDQIKSLDSYTIEHEPIASIDLMERAASRLHQWIREKFPDPEVCFQIFCGTGNNGGDGLALARMLHQDGIKIKLYILQISNQGSRDFQENEQRLPKRGYLEVSYIRQGDAFPQLDKKAIGVDAIFGSGLNRPVQGYWADCIEYINNNISTLISVDIPSGMFADRPTSSPAIRATYTLSFQTPKLGFLMPENEDLTGDWYLLNIGLDQAYLESLETEHFWVDNVDASSILKPRRRFDHKGTFGHALLVCGGYGKVGAALLAARGCLRAGVGKLTVHIPKYAYTAVQTGVPEAMVEVDEHEYWFSRKTDTSGYEAIGIGCGLGQKSVTMEGIMLMLDHAKHPLVLDADALNILAQHPDWLHRLPKKSVLTPHPGEFRRLFGSFPDGFSRLEAQKDYSKTYQITIVLKGANTCITTPSGEAYFNSTGNPGMATAGSGDVLTGVITGLLAQGICPEKAAILGVYLHGLAGDLAIKSTGQYALIASDIIDHLGAASCALLNQQQ